MNNDVCQHNINIEPHTMRFYRRRFMVVPDYLYATCEICNSQIIYQKTESGYAIAKEGNEDED